MYSVIDIESNGAGFRQESIIEIAIYRYNGHEVTDQFISLVNPQSGITPFVQKLTNITEKMVRTAPKFHEIARRVIEITAGTTLVGHNIEFDYRMLRQEFKRLGYDFSINTIDTIPIAKKLIPEAESYSLGKLVKSLGIPMTEAHRAGGDARATLDLFKILIDKDENQEILQQHQEESNAKSYLNKMKDLTANLPSEKGIVYLQNSEGKILHSKFTEDINQYAKKLFSSKAKKYEALQQLTEQIHYDSVGNSVVAKLILKSKGLKHSETLNFGLFYANGKFRVEKNKNAGNMLPIIRFKSLTQGLKALRFIKSNPETNTPEGLLNIISRVPGNEIWSTEGRVLGEKTFLLFEAGKLKSFGFYELHTQIQQRKKIELREINISGEIPDIENDLKLSLLKGEFKFFPLPDTN